MQPVERSYNGWRADRDRHAIGVVQIEVAGASFPNGVVRGDVQTVLGYVAEQFHRRVEPLVPGWCWGYNYRANRNANNLSCHASGTAIDVNAPRHPNGRSGTFTAAQVREIRAILREVPVVRWGGDFRGTPDEMHFEINATAERVAQTAAQLRGSPMRPAPSTGDDMTPQQAKQLADIHARLAKIDTMAFNVNGGSGAESMRDVLHKLRLSILGLVQRDPAQISAEDIAALIPDALAESVLDALVERVKK